MNASDLLTVWERGFGLSHLERPLDLLSLVGVAGTRDDVASLPIGRRDAELYALRRWMFGRELLSTATCPSCGEALEISLDGDELFVESPLVASSVVETDGFRIEFRVPTTSDLITVFGDETSVDVARGALLERCIMSAHAPDGATVAVKGLPDRVVDAAVAAMAEADPQADVTLDFLCPRCGKQWAEQFDIASFLWTELDLWARGLLRDVAALARAYGWTEPDVLRLSPARRRVYMDLAGI